MSRLFRRQRLAGLAALVGLGGLLAAGCSGGGGGSAAPTGLEKTTLYVEADQSLDSAALYIAQERGLFTAEGLNVTILPTKSETEALANQLSGHIDVTAGNYTSYIEANAATTKAAHFRVLAPGSIMQANNQELVVKAGSLITSVTDLKGKTIGVNAASTLGTVLVSSVLNDNAVPVDRNNFITVPFSQMAHALQDGQVQAAWLPEPMASQDEQSIGATPLADLNQGSSQNLPVSGYMVTASWLKKYPNTAQAFRAAILKAQAIAAINPGAVQQGMVKFAGTSKQTSAIANPPEYPTTQSTILLQRLSNLMLGLSLLPQSYNVAPMIVK